MNSHDPYSILKAIGEGYRNLIPVAEVSPTWEITKYTWGGAASYAIGIFLAIYGQFAAMLPDIVSWGGFVLLIVRLIADGPRAFKTLKDYLNGKQGS